MPSRPIGPLGHPPSRRVGTALGIESRVGLEHIQEATLRPVCGWCFPEPRTHLCPAR